MLIKKPFLIILSFVFFLVSFFGNSHGEISIRKIISTSWSDQNGSSHQAELNQKRKFYSPDDLKEVLISGDLDQILIALNDIKVMNYKGKITPLIIDLWNLDLDKHPTVPAKIVMEPIIRVHLAHYLIQRYRNGEIEINTSDLHEFVLGAVSTHDSSLVIDAIIVLHHFEKKSDVDILVELSKKKIYFRPAVISLGMICNPYAGEGLKQILKINNDPESRAFIKRKISGRSSDCKFGIR